MAVRTVPVSVPASSGATRLVPVAVVGPRDPVTPVVVAVHAPTAAVPVAATVPRPRVAEAVRGGALRVVPAHRR